MGHHDEPLEDSRTKVVALADRLSAGERVSTEEAQPQQLLSIFCSMEIDGWQAPTRLYWPLSPLSLDEKIIFPRNKKANLAVEKKYGELWRAFDEEAERLRTAYEGKGYLPAYLESMLLLMQRYTWCIPSAYYRARPDVSLYDHSRMTAALAACLANFEEGKVDQILEALRMWHTGRQQDPSSSPPQVLKETHVALLVGGDISGVQDFIYTITSRGATSALRGRSFYLQLLTEAVARFVLRKLDLPITNLIYQGGGHFYLLARPGDTERLTQAQQDVSRILLAHHQGDLYLALAHVPLVAADFYDGRITGKWGEVSAKLRKAKQRRFSEVPDVLSNLFEPQGHGGNEEQQCQVCGREHTGTEPVDDVQKCPPCQSYERLGDALRHARYLWLTEQEPTGEPEKLMEVPSGKWEDVLAAFGLRAGVADRVEAIPSGQTYRVVLAMDDKAMENLRPDERTAVGRRFLVNVTPVFGDADADWLAQQSPEKRKRLQDDLPDKPRDRVKPFTLLEAQSTGIERLGVLRMDVDDLGRMFQEGFILNKGTSKEEKIGTLSRVAALSFAISLFFEGWVEVLAEQIGQAGDGRQRLYSIYSGGDDLFFVGSWDAVVELARAIRANLSRFAAGHPGVHASAGITLIGGKYPLYQAAEDAKAAEEQAKSLRWRAEKEGKYRRKDAIAFLGRALPWEKFGTEECPEESSQEFRTGEPKTAHTLAHRLVQMVKRQDEGGEGVPSSLIRILVRLQEMYETAAEQRRCVGEDRNQAGEEQVYWGPWMWRGYYFLKRMARRYEKEAPDASHAIGRLAESLHRDRFRAIEWIGLAARWAELLVR
jgi:CRISPR-associated protein Csm1